MTDLRKLAEAATPGPWSIRGETPERIVVGTNEGMWVASLACIENERDERNARFLAACSPAAIIALLDRAERAESELSHHRKWQQDLASELGCRPIHGEMLRTVRAVTAERDALVTALEGTGDSRDKWRTRALADSRALAQALAAMPSDGDFYVIREALTYARVHGYQRGELVGAWLARLDAFRASQAKPLPGDEYDTCARCKGVGSVGMRNCPECDGTGKRKGGEP